MFLFVAWPSKQKMLAKLLIILHDHAYEVKFEQTVIVIEIRIKVAHGSNKFCILRRNIIPNTPSNRVHGSSKFGATT